MNKLPTMMNAMTAYFSAAMIQSATLCAKRLISSLPDPHHISRNKILLAYGGGKDSSYMVAWVRYIQGLLWLEKGATFQLRICTNRHAGMNDQVMANIARVYRALAIEGDDTVECLVIDGLLIRPFQRHLPFPATVRQQNRTDVLMNGHRFRADARSTFCNACNLSMVNAFGLAAYYDGGVDVIITGDSPQEQTAYLAWARHLARLFAAPQVAKDQGFSGFLQTLDGVSERYFSHIYGEGDVTPAHRITWQLPRDPLFFNIYQDTAYEAGAHWALLSDFMGFQFDELMFSFSESDCGNPTLMAHLRGLRAETLLQRSYDEGVSEYARFALGLMRQKDFPPSLIAAMTARYQDTAAIARQRQHAEQFAQDAFGLTTGQLICMIYSPFTAGGNQLEHYLQQQHIPLSASAIRALLRDDAASDPLLCRELETLSGLTLPQLRQCWRSPAVNTLLEPRSPDPLSRILRYDPHKAVIPVRHGTLQDSISEVISGR
ncbi:hypothetical protein [Erwinia sp. V71]|uniref:hypothetical protein n=1 Tax=Erwinia sp. V71 TaxID=3369424 RepID=UPI003F60B654